MVTNDERRDVARRIRAKGSISYYSDVFKLVMGNEPPLGTSAREDDEALAERLADLIEPAPERTCHMTQIGGDYVLAGWWECSECGPVYPPCRDEIARWALQRCPRCGAKVVDDGN